MSTVAEIADTLRSLRDISVPVDARERTWSLLEGALQQQSEPDVLEAAKGDAPSSHPHNAGSAGDRLPCGLPAPTRRDSATHSDAASAASNFGR